LHNCTLPLTGAGVVDMVITDLGVFTVDRKGGGMTLIELAPEVTLDDIQGQDRSKLQGRQHAQTLAAPEAAWGNFVPKDAILETEELTKEFAGFIAVRSVNLRVAPRQHSRPDPVRMAPARPRASISSPNSSRRRVDAFIFDGRDITALKPADVARLGLGRSFQISAVFPHLTVLENVRIALQRRRGNSFDFWRSKRPLRALDDRANAIIADVGLTPYIDAQAVELPYGRKRALEIATTLALEPELLLLDEPTAGMGREEHRSHQRT